MNQENYKDRRDRIMARADQASNEIREAEKLLQEIPLTKDTVFGSIKWDSANKRIIMNGRPLIENKLEARLDGHYYLSCLVNRVILDVEDSFNRADQRLNTK